MKLNQRLFAALSIASLSFVAAASAFAVPGALTGRQLGSRVNVRSGPSSSSRAIHYGLVGDPVEVNQVSQGNDGYPWAHVQFSSGAQGWVRGDFVNVPQAEQQSKSPITDQCTSRHRFFEDRLACIREGLIERKIQLSR